MKLRQAGKSRQRLQPVKIADSSFPICSPEMPALSVEPEAS
jgi:hypothetical protein